MKRFATFARRVLIPSLLDVAVLTIAVVIVLLCLTWLVGGELVTWVDAP